MRIWCNNLFDAEGTRILRASAPPHELIESVTAKTDVLVPGADDPEFLEAEVAFGQPPVEGLLASRKLRWVHLSTAGFGPYDRDDLRESLRERGIPLTTSSAVFADPCAQHMLALMLASARKLPDSMRDQLTTRKWAYEGRRYQSRLLTGSSVLIFGFGNIGRRLAELLEPFRMRIAAVRRSPDGDEGVEIVSPGDIASALANADHVVNLLPNNSETRGYFDAAKFSAMKQGACFYNIGRGKTVDQAALLDALNSEKLAAACLDVTDPEPLPPDHPLWSAPNCIITPHTGGGRLDQDPAIVRHFYANLARFERGEPLENRIF